MATRADPTAWPVEARTPPATESLERLLDDPSDADASWLVVLRRELARLREDLERHYEAEEATDLYVVVPLQHPRFRQPLLTLVSEHDTIRALTDELVRATHRAAVDPPRAETIRLRTRLLLATIRRHEAAEDEIVLTAALESRRSLPEDSG